MYSNETWDLGEAQTSFLHVPTQKVKKLPNPIHTLGSFIPSYYFVTSLQVVYKSNRFCCAVGMLRRVSSRPAMSNSASTKSGSWPVVATISPQGLMMVLCPQAW